MPLKLATLYVSHKNKIKLNWRDEYTFLDLGISYMTLMITLKTLT